MKILLTDNYQGDSQVVFEHKPISKEKLNIVCRTIETAVIGSVVVITTHMVGTIGLFMWLFLIGSGLLIKNMMEC